MVSVRPFTLARQMACSLCLTEQMARFRKSNLTLAKLRMTRALLPPQISGQPFGVCSSQQTRFQVIRILSSTQSKTFLKALRYQIHNLSSETSNGEFL